MADEALKSLTDLLDSVPGWINELENILERSTDRQTEILLENHSAGPPAQLSRKASKSSSLLSRRATDGVRADQDAASREPAEDEAVLRTQLPYMTQSDALRLAQRKRKTASALSDLSGPPRFRSRGAVVVYYDGETQKQFERVVRAIGANRNALRKGKIVAKVDKFSRAGSGSSSEASSGEGPISMRSHKFPYVTTRAVQGKNTPGIKDKTTEAFEQLDALLDKAQALCEKAAHQVLRDGDCGMEMRAAKSHVVEISMVAEEELPVLQKRAEKIRERQQREQEREKAEREDTKAEKDRSTPDNTNEKPENPFASPGSLEVDLEADDSDEDDDVNFEVGALQLNKFGIRSTRSPALGTA